MSDNTTINKTYVFAVAGLASIAGLLLGFDIGLTSSALGHMAAVYGLGASDHGLTGLLVSGIFWGGLAGAVLASFMATRFGRRESIILCAMLFGLGSLCVALSSTYAFGFGGKMLVGVAVGISAVIVPMYVSEISPPEIRGTALFFFQAAISFGFLLSFGTFWLLGGGELWRWVCGAEFALAAVLGLGMLKAPNSPRMLVLGGNDQEARNVLRLTLGRQDVEREIRSIHETLGHGSGGWASLLSRRYLPLALAGAGLFFMQQAAGVAAVTCYATQVFEAAGFEAGGGALFAATLLGVMNVASVIPGSVLVERLGRRKLLLWGSALSVLCLCALGGSYMGAFPPGVDLRWVRLASILSYVLFFTCSLGGVPWVMLGELFPLKVRGPGMALGSCMNWGMNLLVSGTYLALRHAVGLGPIYLLYACMTVGCMAAAFIFLPETKDRPLEDIEANLFAGKPLRRLGDPVERR
ncbi:sugar porter family MFS transporter [Salidesulfovibrio onnuriiensis]|uniref:sugar porter family MFS transporter n=1 Tax=Salidesulfovibrio onnuriiensis TaxID=2583823 RepID=UPI0011C74AE8|nr:sugar porter family MFS transporter [Salidesulfovibrio onnuriiensis]